MGRLTRWGTALALALVAYRRRLRRPILTWGATDDEATARLPGDELLERPDGGSTRAITVDALLTHTYRGLAEVTRAFGPDPATPAYVKGVVEL